ncbi:MAG: histidinol dehydrogenase [Fimbriimonadaceae bacterium]|nr:histidinol dehydrogenase [Fimbriimonadaceae bacterium]
MSLLPVVEYGHPEMVRFLDRSPSFDPGLVATVAAIVADVRSRGAEAVLSSAVAFDSPDIKSLYVTDEELAEATVDPEVHFAIKTAIQRVQDFHELQLQVLTEDMDELEPGWGWRTDATDADDTGFEGQRYLPLARVGVYVPGGLASYPSSVVMNVVPAQVAGVPFVVVATPVRKDGTVCPEVLVACRELDVDLVLKAGGASAVAAMAFGIEGMTRVDKVVGPGNAYVNEAKRQVWGTVGLDGYAGPSEVAVYADASADPRWAAASLLCQLEHAPDNVGLLVARDRTTLDAVTNQVEALVADSPRQDVLRRSLSERSCAVVAATESEAVEIINRFAPEHCTLMVANAGSVAQQVVNCGCVLVGPNTPQSAGDYCSGPSHTLPTSGAARFGSPVNVLDFLKVQSVTMLTSEDIHKLAPTITALANAEGFPGHARDALVRVE